MQKKETSWRLKVNKTESKVIDIPVGQLNGRENGSMLIPDAREIEQLIHSIPKGTTITIDDIREYLAKKHSVNLVCHITTGIYLKMVANASVEENYSIPFWRVVSSKGELYPRFPGGLEFQLNKLLEEGVNIDTSDFPRVSFS